MPSVPPQQWPPLWWHLFALPLLQFLHLSWLPLSLQVPKPGIHIHFQVLLKTICILVNLQVSFVISDILQCVGYHSNPHVNKIRAGNLEHPLGKLFSVSVDFLKVSFQKSMHTKKKVYLNCHWSHDSSLMSLQCFKSNLQKANIKFPGWPNCHWYLNPFCEFLQFLPNKIPSHGLKNTP